MPRKSCRAPFQRPYVVLALMLVLRCLAFAVPLAVAVTALAPAMVTAEEPDDDLDDNDGDDDDGGFDVDDLDDYDDFDDDDGERFDELNDDLERFEDELTDEEGFLTATAEIIAFDVEPDQLRIVESLGFRLVERQPLYGVAGSIDRLEAPAEYATLEQAIDALRSAVPAAPFDVNHLYDLPESDPSAAGPDVAAGAVGKPGAGQGVRIGIIDTLIDPDHPSLRGQRLSVRDFAGSGDRERVHATAVASILVGRDDEAGYLGLLPAGELFAVNVFTLGEDGRPRTDTFTMIRALDWLAEQRVGVISVSVAGPPSTALEAMLGRLQSLGHLVVAAVGNDGPAAPPLYPAAYADVIGVTAVDADLRVYRRAGRGAHVDYSARGVHVRAAVANGGYAAFTGTSFATPVIAALLAGERRNTGSGPLTTVDRKIRDLGRPGRDEVYGDGLLLASDP